MLHLSHVKGVEAEKRFKLETPRNLYAQRCPQVAVGDAKAIENQIRNYVHNTFELYESIFEGVNSTNAFTVPPVHKLRHPLIFYYGHTGCFYINKLCVAGLTSRINPHFEEMFAVGVDEMSWDDLNEAHYSWPNVEEVTEYRKLVRDRLDQLMTSGKFKLTLPLTFESSTTNDDNAFWWVMLMAAEHERIHIETASVHVRELPIEMVKPEHANVWKRCPESSNTAPTNELVPVTGGTVRVGRPQSSSVYGWDCDYANDGYEIEVKPFRASRFIVSNAEFFRFMKSDGYKTQKYWDEEGWSWATWKKPEHPWFWVKDESRPDGYALRLQTELINLPWNWPCELNNLEARAFCNFKSELTGKKLRMLTEAEWLLLHDRYVKQDMPTWDVAPGNINLEHYQSSCPVDQFAHGPFYDVIGNVWQHCETPTYPYPGYRVHPFYDDFSLPTFDGRHACMKGGTWVSTGNEATRDARFAFRRHFFQYIGLRYVEGEEVNEQKYLRNVLGLDPEVDIITDISFGKPFGPIPNASLAIATFAQKLFREHSKLQPLRALDIACGAGRVTLELTNLFKETVGVDTTARRLIPAFAIRERGTANYSTVADNGQRVEHLVNSNDYDWSATRENATFFQADPTNLHAHINNFDLIVAWDILERTYNPAAVPAHLLSRLNAGGLLIIGGDFQWNRTWTQPTMQLSASSRDDVRNPSEEIARILGDAVKPVSALTDFYVAMPDNSHKASLRKVQLQAFIKL